MGKFNKHIIITGSARSGTSWLSETMAQTFRYRMLFEPDHPDHVPKASLIADRWIVTGENHGVLDLFLASVLRNKLDNDWIAQNSNRKYKMHLWPFLAKKYIVKLIRSNLAVYYLSESLKTPLIHLVRNPYDVLFSQQRVKFPWLYDLSIFQEQEELVGLIKEQVNFNICQESFSNLEKLSIRWCIENVIALKTLKPSKTNVRVIRYEDLKNDIKVYKELCSEFNIELAPNIDEIYQKPSSKTHPKSAINKGDTKTQAKFSKLEKMEIDAILEAFGQDLYPLKSKEK